MKSGHVFRSRRKNTTDFTPKGSWGFGQSLAISVKSRLVKHDYFGQISWEATFFMHFWGFISPSLRAENLQFFHWLLGSKGNHTMSILLKGFLYGSSVCFWNLRCDCLSKKMMAELRGGYLFEDVWRMTFSTNGLMVNWQFGFLGSPDERDWDS